MAEFIEILILSAIQGISEFIPVSSSAHLYLMSEVQNFEIKSLLTDVSLHLGSLLAILFYFRDDFLKLFKDQKLLKLLIFGSLPLIIVGFFVFKTGLINYFRSIEIIAWTTVIFAIFLYIADKFSVRKKIDTDLNLRAILAIGIFQVLALIPGVSRAGIIFRHLIPNSVGPVIVYATLTVPQIMLLEAFLSFLGLGVQAPLSSWGLLIRDGAVSMEEYWWLLIFPSLAFSLTLFSLNFIGDGLRDALDPRTADN